MYSIYSIYCLFSRSLPNGLSAKRESSRGLISFSVSFSIPIPSGLFAKRESSRGLIIFTVSSPNSKWFVLITSERIEMGSTIFPVFFPTRLQVVCPQNVRAFSRGFYRLYRFFPHSNSKWFICPQNVRAFLKRGCFITFTVSSPTPIRSDLFARKTWELFFPHSDSEWFARKTWELSFPHSDSGWCARKTWEHFESFFFYNPSRPFFQV